MSHCPIFEAKVTTMHSLLAIIWDIHPEVFGFLKDNAIPVRWYGLLFASTFLIGYKLMENMFKRDGVPEKWLDKVFVYVIVGTIIGARLGHVLFYGPYHTPDGTGYFDQPLSILKVWEGGLASHGAAIAIIISLYFYSKKITKKSVLWILDRVVITVAIAGCLIRTGNLMNSEMIGKASDSGLNFIFTRYTEDYIGNRLGDRLEDIEFEDAEQIIDYKGRKVAVMEGSIEINNRLSEELFERYLKEQLPLELERLGKADQHVIIDPEAMNLQIESTGRGFEAEFVAYGVVRHPAQLYEAISYLLIFLLLYFLYWKKEMYQQEGFIFGMFLILIFGARFFIEFLKENQVDFEENLAFNMGQNLSIPLVAAGIFFVVRALKMQPKK